MFLTNKYSGHNRHGEQSAAGLFLIIAQCTTHKQLGPNLRCIVRHARMTQFGAWMMARVRVKGHKITLSGTYGSDGLPCDVEPDLYDLMHPIPKALQDAFWAGGGHNTGGSEMQPIRAWALENVDALRKPALLQSA
jgi:hypothetical protein